MIHIQVNNKPYECPEESTLQQLTVLLQLPEKGVAVAVNNRIVPRAAWDTHTVRENDSLVVIKAACGG